MICELSHKAEKSGVAAYVRQRTTSSWPSRLRQHRELPASLCGLTLERRMDDRHSSKWDLVRPPHRRGSVAAHTLDAAAGAVMWQPIRTAPIGRFVAA